jgi:hypothetical protein
VKEEIEEVKGGRSRSGEGSCEELNISQIPEQKADCTTFDPKRNEIEIIAVHTFNLPFSQR